MEAKPVMNGIIDKNGIQHFQGEGGRFISRQSIVDAWQTGIDNSSPASMSENGVYSHESETSDTPILRRIGQVAAAGAIGYMGVRGLETFSPENTRYMAEASVLSISGLRNALSARRDARTSRLRHSIDFHQNAAQASLDLQLPEYERTADTTISSASVLQEQRALKHNARLDKLNKIRIHHETTMPLYAHMLSDGKNHPIEVEAAEEILSSKDSLRGALASGHFTRAQKKTLRGAARQFRKAHKVEKRTRQKLDRAAWSEDLPSKVVRRRLSRR